MTGPDRHPSPASIDPAAAAADRAASEAVPRTWDELRDSAFFRITARVFDPTAALAMTVLLASYDPEPAAITAVSAGD